MKSNSSKHYRPFMTIVLNRTAAVHIVTTPGRIDGTQEDVSMLISGRLKQKTQALLDSDICRVF